jgi:general stress protein CsbA
MAGQVNTFKTVTAEVTTENVIVYAAPFGITTIILMAQVANITENTHSVTFTHVNVGSNTNTELLKNYSVPKNDAVGLLTGKLIVQQNNAVKISASANDVLKLTMSILETTNA